MGIIFSLLLQFALAEQCTWIWGLPGKAPNKSFSGIVATSSQRKIWVQYSKHRSAKDTVVLLHGILDQASKLENLSQKLLSQGYHVLRVDLHGHGQTLFANYKRLEDIPDKIDYRDNVTDIIEILEQLQIQNPILIGHSYGAAIGYEIARQYPAKKLLLLAPYVGRLDQFLVESRNQNWIQFQLENLVAIGIPENIARAMLAPQQQARNFTKYWQEYINTVAAFPELRDFYQDPFVTEGLTFLYKKYVKEEERDQDSTKMNWQVKAAVAATRGIRPFNLLQANQKIAISTPIVIIGAEKDVVVPALQLKMLARKLQAEDANYQLIFIDRADHQFPKVIDPNLLLLTDVLP